MFNISRRKHNNNHGLKHKYLILSRNQEVVTDIIFVDTDKEAARQNAEYYAKQMQEDDANAKLYYKQPVYIGAICA